MIEATVHFEEPGKPTTGAKRRFARVPVQGEFIRTANGRWQVGTVEWTLEGQPLVVASKVAG